MSLDLNDTTHCTDISFLQLLFKYDLVKYDMVQDEPVKDQYGFCQRVEKGRRIFPQIYFLFRIYLFIFESWHQLRILYIDFRLCVLFSFSGETGLLLSKVSAISPFFGYAGSKQLTEKKLMRNVFMKGDAYFNTGDLMAEDQEGFICFRDRVGDTFRYSRITCLSCWTIHQDLKRIYKRKPAIQTRGVVFTSRPL